MRRSCRIVLSFLLVLSVGLACGTRQHDDVHAEGRGVDRHLDFGAAHAAEAGHIEASGTIVSASCFACLLRLHGSTDLAPPSTVGRTLPVHAAARLTADGPPRQEVATHLASRAPPLA